MKISAATKQIKRREFSVSARNFQIELGIRTKLMGIINATPDSFSQDGCLKNTKTGTSKAINLAKKMIREGADIIDVGGESSRPGSKRISLEEESKRVIPIIRTLAKQTQTPISVDTYKSGIAMQALDAGASIINNIKGVKAEKTLLKMVKNYDAAVILMHMKGTPRTMQKNIQYDDVIAEIYSALRNSIENCLEIGIKSDRIIIDPGIGFGKTIADNLNILKQLGSFQRLNQPILIGASRKSFIGKILNKNVNERVFGSAAAACASILNGAHILRVHDIAATKDTAVLTDAILNINS